MSEKENYSSKLFVKLETSSSPCNPRLLHYQSKDTTNVLGLTSSNSFTNLAHRPHYSNSNSEQSEKTSSSTADLNKEFSSSIKINFNSISKNNVNESSEDNNTNLNESKIEVKNSILKNLTSFSQIVYQSRVKHFVNAVEANKNASNGTESTELISEHFKPTKSNLNTNKALTKINSPTNGVSPLLNAPSSSCRVNVVKPKQSIATHFIQRSNEVEYQADRRLDFYRF